MKIHLNSRQGMYTVTSYNDTYIWLVTSKLPEFTVPCTDFKSFAGSGYNHDVTTAESDRFLSVVNPSMFQHQQKMTESIMEAVKALSMQPMKHANNNEPDEADNIQYENWYYQKTEEFDRYKDKIRKTASEVYKQKLDFSNLEITKGIKFIIQKNRDDNSYRFCFDPYSFVDNFHSAISDVFREIGWNTINGGWIKVIEHNVVLYAQSGDYGVYDDSIAIEAASKLFPNHKIFSHAGRQWDAELTEKYDDLPF
jgi:hypothetical protein